MQRSSTADPPYSCLLRQARAISGMDGVSDWDSPRTSLGLHSWSSSSSSSVVFALQLLPGSESFFSLTLPKQLVGIDQISLSIRPLFPSIPSFFLLDQFLSFAFLLPYLPTWLSGLNCTAKFSFHARALWADGASSGTPAGVPSGGLPSLVTILTGLTPLLSQSSSSSPPASSSPRPRCPAGSGLCSRHSAKR